LSRVKLTFSVKVIDMTNGDTVAKRAIKPRLQKLTCSGRPLPAGADPATAATVSTLEGWEEPDDPEVQGRCAEIGVAPPTRFSAVFRFKRSLPVGSYGREKWRVRYFYTAMPKECKGVVERLSHQAIQIQDPSNHQRWLNIMRRNWVGLDASEGGGWGGGSWSTSQAPLPGKKKIVRVNYACTPGSGVTQMKLLIKAGSQAKEPGHRRLRQHIYEMPVKVIGAC